MQPTWPCYFTNTMLVFHLPWFTPTQYLFSVGHSLHTRFAWFSFVTLLILSTSRCICLQHPPDSSQVKTIYYTSSRNLVNYNHNNTQLSWEGDPPGIVRHYFSDIVEKLLIVCNITFLLNNFYQSLFIMIKHMYNNISMCFY